MTEAQDSAQILVLEDEEDLAFLLRQNLEREGHRARTRGTLRGARAELARGRFDLLLLDVNLPDGDGFELLEGLRREGVWTPALFLTARSEEKDRLRGFACGGDDYVTKPFSMAELMARISAIVRRARLSQPTQGYECSDFSVDFSRYRLRVKGQEEQALTYLESELLRYLVARPGQGVARSELLNEVWGYERYPTTRTVDTHVLNLRRKLEPEPARPRYLLTVHGVGYKFVP